jgi:tripartite-type tricarboxylate transporter receptor subunit TctC
VVENKGGAGGNLAAEAVARSPKDGYTLHLATNGLANARAMGASYDPIQDFAPIVVIATGPQMLVAHPSVGVDNLQQLIALAKAKPDRITYGGGSGFTMTGLGGVLLSNMADIKLLHVPYTGSAPALVDLLAGRIDLLFAPALAVIVPGRARASQGHRHDIGRGARALLRTCRPWRNPDCPDTTSACGTAWSRRRARRAR